MTDLLQETDRIESDLARTRARMEDRLDQLQDRMSPAQLANDAFAYLQGGDGAEFTANVISRAKANPLPVALVGVGLAWLMASSHARSPSVRPADGGGIHARLTDAERGIVRLEDEDEASHESRLDDARGKVLGIVREAADTAGSYGERIKTAIGSATRTGRRTLHDAQGGAGQVMAGLHDKISNGATNMQEGTSNMSDTMRRSLSSVTENPLALGALAAVIGLVAGSLLPTLDGEQSALGSSAGKLKSAGRDFAQDVVDRGGRIANDTLAAVKDSADAHGLTSGKSVGDVARGLNNGDLLGDVKQVAQEALQAGRDSAQTHLTSASADTPAGA